MEEDKVTHNIYETTNCLDMAFINEKEAGSAASTAAASAGSEGSLANGHTGLLPTRLEVKGWKNWKHVQKDCH